MPISSDIDEEIRERFLAKLAEVGNPSGAASAVGLSARFLSDLRRADSEFSAAWEEAIRSWKANLEREALRRALQGTASPLIVEGKLMLDDKGKMVSTREYSDELLVSLLRAHLSKFKDKRIIEHSFNPKWLPYILLIFALIFGAWAIGELVENGLRGYSATVGISR